eukprot:352694-Rhodomonas_salina.3
MYSRSQDKRTPGPVQAYSRSQYKHALDLSTNIRGLVSVQTHYRSQYGSTDLYWRTLRIHLRRGGEHQTQYESTLPVRELSPTLLRSEGATCGRRSVYVCVRCTCLRRSAALFSLSSISRSNYSARTPTQYRAIH